MSQESHNRHPPRRRRLRFNVVSKGPFQNRVNFAEIKSSLILLILLRHIHIASSWTITNSVRTKTTTTRCGHFHYYRTLSSTSSDNNVGYENDDSGARSQFGTREYWDDMYQGMGDFDKEEYTWYFGWSNVKSHFTEHIPPPSADSLESKEYRILIPGMGNDPLLLDMVGAGYRDITAFDYSEGAVERQAELLSYDAVARDFVQLYHLDARALKEEWTGSFDAILEKGCLDALYLCGDGNVEKAAEELHRVLKPGAVFMSVSGVVPSDLRKDVFSADRYEWLRDGSGDLKAGCFVWRKK